MTFYSCVATPVGPEVSPSLDTMASVSAQSTSPTEYGRIRRHNTG